MNSPIVEKLQQLKQAGAAWQKDLRGERATNLLRELEGLLKPEEYLKVSIARSHYLIGEGRQELDIECNALIQKYRLNPPDPRKRTLL